MGEIKVRESENSYFIKQGCMWVIYIYFFCQKHVGMEVVGLTQIPNVNPNKKRICKSSQNCSIRYSFS